VYPSLATARSKESDNPSVVNDIYFLISLIYRAAAAYIINRQARKAANSYFEPNSSVWLHDCAIDRYGLTLGVAL
jgi:hypothetical protein